jgi:hypothetical protein
MKGIVLTAFVDFSERELPAAADALEGRSYDASITYPDEELAALVAAVAAGSGLAPAEVTRRFGMHLFETFAALYPVFVAGIDSALDLLAKIETYVHGEVKKLYPDAAFPRFEVSTPAPGRLEMVYASPRPLADLAEGMILGCVRHFGETIDVRREDVAASRGREARFSLRLVPKRGRVQATRGARPQSSQRTGKRGSGL